VPTVEPEVVAEAIADAVSTKAREVFIPKSLKTMIALTGLLPRRVREASMKSSGSLTTFLDIDHSQRRAYDDRIERS
jgi:short-subunit dehydrogenase